MSDYKQTRDAAGKVTKQYDKMLRSLGDVEELEAKLKWADEISNIQANRIEELEADLRKMALDYLAAEGQAAEAYQAQLVAEVKLQKAIDALEKVQAFVRDLEPHADQGHTLVPALREACETLAELKGETDA
jgi:hypothetical protein